MPNLPTWLRSCICGAAQVTFALCYLAALAHSSLWFKLEQWFVTFFLVNMAFHFLWYMASLLHSHTEPLEEELVIYHTNYLQGRAWPESIFLHFQRELMSFFQKRIICHHLNVSISSFEFSEILFICLFIYLFIIRKLWFINVSNWLVWEIYKAFF